MRIMADTGINSHFISQNDKNGHHLLSADVVVKELNGIINYNSNFLLTNLL